MSRKHKQRRAIRREVAIEVRRQVAQLKRELISAQIHSQPATYKMIYDVVPGTRFDELGFMLGQSTKGNPT